jgi:hypothetical protein
MHKIKKKSILRYMRLLFFLFCCVISALGSWYAWEHTSELRQFVNKHIPSSQLRTLEIRYSAEEIMQAHKTELLKSPEYTFLEPKLLFYPYVLMEVKYSKGNGETNEGILLWGLNDGEMVIKTATWEKTHGFEDCLAAKIDKNDFRILDALIVNGGMVERDKLYTLFNVDQASVDHWIDRCREKKLIATSGNKLRLHVQNAILKNEPVTLIDQPLVTQPANTLRRVKGRYSITQITHLAEIAFGQEFAIRKTEEVFLPIYAISVQNPDGSIFTTHWNALNGKKLDKGFSIQ